MAVIEVTGASFEKEVVQSDRPVLADFYANWCGPCRMLRPTLEAIADERQDIKVVSINIDEEDDLADAFGISSIADRSVGLRPKEAIEEMLG